MNLPYKLKTTLSSIIFINFFIFSTLFNSSCKCNQNKAAEIENKVEIPKDELEFQNDISTVLREYIPTLPSVKIDSTKYESWHELAKDIYLQNNYKSLWLSKDVLSSRGKEMLHVLGTAEF